MLARNPDLAPNSSSPQRRLDRSRPLWQLWFLPGLAQARVGLVMKVHHAIADGVAGVAAFGAFLDVSGDAPAPSPPPWTPAPVPSGRDLLADNLRRRVHGFQGLLSWLAHPAGTVRGARGRGRRNARFSPRGALPGSA